jgi:DNA-binding transcriptional MerR regulator
VYTVKQLADLAGVTIRTLHYYDEIGLLKPSSVGDNGYRYYEDEALLQLQQILLFREMDLGLLQIKEIIERPEFDVLTALRSHRTALQERVTRLQCLINTVDSTILHLVGEVDMSNKSLFEGFSEEKQKQYEQEIANDPRYDQDKVKESVRRWKNYTPQQKKQIGVEGQKVYEDLIAAMDKGPESEEVQAVLARWHQHLRYFYEPTPEILRGLGHLYNEHPDFIANFQKLHPDLPAFLEVAIGHYCDRLAVAEPVGGQKAK